MIKSNLLSEHFPNFIKDWNIEKNIGLDKNKITIGSSRILVHWKCHKCGYEWKQKVINRVKFKTECKVCRNSGNLLRFSNPELFDEIDFEKNKNIDFNVLTKGISKKLWWKCKNGHSWLQSIDTRVKLGASCKECKNIDNSIVKTHPNLILDWDFNKNGSLNPNSITKGSNKKVWWICNDCKHSFQCSVDRRTRGTNCAKCRQRVQLKIPLSKNFYHLLEEWDFNKNTSFNPDTVSEGSNIKAHWICKNGHQFQMIIYNRTKLGLSCPFCRGLKVNSTNSLETLRPDLVKEWFFEKNNNISPNDVTLGSNKLVWWKCKNGHSWKSSIYNRTKLKGTKCPMCSGRSTTEQTNIQFLHPELMKEWDWKKNSVKPTEMRPGSNKKVWWVCTKNKKHSWLNSVNHRIKGKIGCPFCSGRYTLRENSLGILNPKFMKEWDWEKNKELDPFALSPKSEKKVWWKCLNDKNHIWRTNISHRTEGTICPYCSSSNLILRKYVKNQKLNLSDKIILYFLVIYNHEEMFYKIGITKNTIEERYRDLYNKTGYKVIKVKIIKDTLHKIVNEEQTIHRKVSRKLDTNLIKYRPKKTFGGSKSECYEVPSDLMKYKLKLSLKYNSNEPIMSIYRI